MRCRSAISRWSNWFAAREFGGPLLHHVFQMLLVGLQGLFGLATRTYWASKARLRSVSRPTMAARLRVMIGPMTGAI